MSRSSLLCHPERSEGSDLTSHRSRFLGLRGLRMTMSGEASSFRPVLDLLCAGGQRSDLAQVAEAVEPVEQTRVLGQAPGAAGAELLKRDLSVDHLVELPFGPAKERSRRASRPLEERRCRSQTLDQPP